MALPNSEIMIQQPSGGAQGQATEIKIVAEQILKTKRKLNEILAANTGKPLEQIEIDTERDNYMSAEEAKAYGLIDELVRSKSVVPAMRLLWHLLPYPAIRFSCNMLKGRKRWL